MRDFTDTLYRRLLEQLKENGYAFQTFRDFIVSPGKRVVVIRHDVDRRKKNSLRFAYIEHALGLRTSYYFRIHPGSFDPVVVDLIKTLGHEIGYHYEDLTLAHGNMEKAIGLFRQHLNEIRHICAVETICMHGSPLSKYDNRDLWKVYDYREYGIIGEPYFDVDYSKMLYLTDTGRSWNNSTSIRDRVPDSFQLNFRSTFEILNNMDKLPDKVMFNFHPQRWADDLIPWLRELIFQNVKNSIKKFFFVSKHSGEY